MSGLLGQAREEVETAELLAGLGKLRPAIRSAYYAAFYAASAALDTVGRSAKTHRGLRIQFHDHFVRTNRVAVDDAAILANVFSRRLDADYDDGGMLTDSLVEATLQDVARFVQMVAAMIEEE